jgi:hypothetical protein
MWVENCGQCVSWGAGEMITSKARTRMRRRKSRFPRVALHVTRPTKTFTGFNASALIDRTAMGEDSEANNVLLRLMLLRTILLRPPFPSSGVRCGEQNSREPRLSSPGQTERYSIDIAKLHTLTKPLHPKTPFQFTLLICFTTNSPLVCMRFCTSSVPPTSTHPTARCGVQAASCLRTSSESRTAH